MAGIFKARDIERLCMLSTTFAKAEILCSREAVGQFELRKQKDMQIEVRTKVQGSGRRRYDSRFCVQAGPGGFHVSHYGCDCPAFLSGYQGICKHLAAAMLELSMQMEDWELQDFFDNGEIGEKRTAGQIFVPVQTDIFHNYPSGSISTASGRTFTGRTRTAETSKPLLELMSSMMVQKQNRFCQEHALGDVVLEPTLNVGMDEETLEFRIGTVRLYVVKSIPQLMDNIRRQRFVKYGKNLEFVHNQSAFSGESQKLIELVRRAKLPEPAGGYYYNRPQGDPRRLKLEGYMLDSLLEIYEGKSLYVQSFWDYDRVWTPVKREDPVLPMKIAGNPNGKSAKLEFPQILVLEGAQNFSVLWNNCIYLCSEEFCRDMGDVVRLMAANWVGEERSTHHFIRKTLPKLELIEKDYTSFASMLLPVMEQYMDVQKKDVDFSNYQVEEGRFELYFDLLKNQDVVCHAKAIYGEKEHDLVQLPRMTEAYRDISTEYELRVLLEQYFPEKSEDSRTYVLRRDDDRLAALVEFGIGQMESLADIYASEEFKKIRIANKLQVSTGLGIKGNLLQVSWDVEGMSAQELTEVLSSYRRRKKYHRLKSGELLNLEDEGLGLLAGLTEDLQLKKAQLKEGMAQIPMYRAMYLDAMMRENVSRIQTQRNEQFQTLVEQFDKRKEERFELPEQVQAKLRPYQEEGYQWIRLLADLGFGGILADDMGLGKTLQMITYLCTAREETHLVVCPASLVYNWEAEFHKFAPGMRLCLMAGTAAQRAELINTYRDYDVVITSYDLLKRDMELYEGKSFGCEVIDEAQYIKNPGTQAAKAVKTVASRCRFALTGTPIENRLSELWSIFEYLMPGYLYSYKHFREVFEEPILQKTTKEDRALQRLHAMIRPFLLRRLKKDVLKDLPEKVEEVVYSRMGAAQGKLYQAAEKNIVLSLQKKSNQEFKENKLQILAEITRLRQLCCDPALVYENYKKGSAKADTCLDLIESSLEGGHGILLFSQFATMLEHLRKELDKRNISSFLLTGKTSKPRRREMVQQFQEGKRKVFLISLKAGGTGLNLTAADIVIHYDPWWNVAAQNQATDRAHRIGQDNPVTVIKLIARDTIEERIIRLQEKKQDLADKIISQENVSMASVTKEELLSLFDLDK